MKHLVGVGEVKVSAASGDSIVTHALGSCLGITLHDAVTGIGGLLHAMLPTATLNPRRAVEKPAQFIDTGLEKLVSDCCRIGASRSRLLAKVAGGAESSIGGRKTFDHFQIGRRNFEALEQLLRDRGIPLGGHDIGGTDSRTMLLEISSGAVILTINGASKHL